MDKGSMYQLGLEIAKPIIKEIVEVFVKPALSEVWNKLRIEKEVNKLRMLEKLEEYLQTSYLKNYYIAPLALRSPIELDKIYVPLTLEKTGTDNNQPSDNERYRLQQKIKKTKDRTVFRMDHSWSSLIKIYNKILIVDHAGMGKSTLNKFLFIKAAEEKLAIPVLLEARRISEKGDVLTLLCSMLGELNKDLDKSVVSELVNTGNFIFLIDGLDEIQKSKKSDTLCVIDEFITKSSKNIFVMASRPDNDLNKFCYFTKFNILPLFTDESFQLLRNYDLENKYSQPLIDKLHMRAYQDVTHFLHNPLLCSLLFVTYSYKGDIPFKKHLYYRQLYDALYEKHDANKPDPVKREKLTNLDIEQFDNILRAFAFLTITNTHTEYSREICLDVLKNCKKLFSDYCFNSTDCIHDLVKNVPLFVEDGLFIKWMHKSLQEYFAARFLCFNLKSNIEQSMYYFIAELERYHNLIDFCYDIDIKHFSNFVIQPMLEKLTAHSVSIRNRYRGKIDKNEITRRIELTFATNYAIKKRNVGDDPYRIDTFTDSSGLVYRRDTHLSKVFSIYMSKNNNYNVCSFLFGKRTNLLKKTRNNLSAEGDLNLIYSAMSHGQTIIINEEDGNLASPRCFTSINNLLENISEWNICYEEALKFQKKACKSKDEEKDILFMVFGSSEEGKKTHVESALDTRQ